MRAMREELEPDLVRIRAPNPGPLTGTGTNTYILGSADRVVIDPGPDHDGHLEALLAETEGAIAAILVTHSHLDHSLLVPRLKEATGADVYAFGPSGAGQSDIMRDLAKDSDIGGSEGADPAFRPDVTLADGEAVTLSGQTIRALHTPGHFGNHLCFEWRSAVFSGDHVMGWATTLVSPPHGDLTDFMASCRRLAASEHRIFYPGHGDLISDPALRLAELMAHRTGRENQIQSALRDGPRTARELTEAIYTDVSESLWPAAERNVLAHLIDLTARNIAAPEGLLTRHSVFSLKG